MDWDIESDFSNDSTEEELLPQSDTLSGKKKIRFSEAQKTCLNTFYLHGMTGIGKKHSVLIEQAARDTHLTTHQIKVR